MQSNRTSRGPWSIDSPPGATGDVGRHVMVGRIVVPLRRRGELVEFATAPLACGHGTVRVRLAVGPALRRCEVCKRSSLIDIHRSAIQEAWIVDPAVIVGQMTFAEALEPPRAATKRRRPTES